METWNTFNGKQIRSRLSSEGNELFFSAVDIVSALVDTSSPRRYWSDLKRTLEMEKNELYEKIGQLEIAAADGKKRKTDVLDKDAAAAVAERISPPHTELFIEWLAQFDETERKYVLKHKDVDVVEIEIDEGGAIRSVGKLFNTAHLPAGTANVKGADAAAIREWWKGRSIPAGREGLKDMLHYLEMWMPHELLRYSFGLSLSDQYWICPVSRGLRWEEMNFFRNDFSEDVGDMLLGETVEKEMEDVSLLSPDNTTEGMLKKKWKTIDGKRCLIKSGSSTVGLEIANEVLATRICERLGIPHVRYDIIDTDGGKYAVCEDFITGETELVTAWHVRKLIKKDNSVSDYESFIAKAEELGIADARQRMEMMLVLDFIIANTDRHYNNFGLIRNADTLEWISFAPIYDSGTSMWCRELTPWMDGVSMGVESKPFRSTHEKQIKLVKDFSWLDITALDGIEEE